MNNKQYGKWKVTPEFLTTVTDRKGNKLKGLFTFQRGVMVHLPDENRWVTLKDPIMETGPMMEVKEEQEGAKRFTIFDPETFEPIHHWFLPLEEEKDPVLEVLKGERC